MYFRGFPVVQGAIHYLVWSNTLLQISLLFSVEIVSFFLCAYSQMRKKIVKIKTVFSVECILDLIALLNFLIYLKYIFLQSFIDEQGESIGKNASDAVEDSILVTIYGSVVFIGISLIIAILQPLKSLFCFNCPVVSHQKDKIFKKKEGYVACLKICKAFCLQFIHINTKTKYFMSKIIYQQKLNKSFQLNYFQIKIIIALFMWFLLSNFLFIVYINRISAKMLLVILMMLLKSSSGIIAGYYYYQFGFLKLNKCSAYVGQRICVVYDASVSINISTIQYMTFYPNATLSLDITGVNQNTAAGMTYSFSNPMYAVSNNKVGGNYELNVVNSTAQYLFAHNYSSYYKLLIAEDKNAIPKFYYFLISNSSATNFTTNICYKIMPSPTCVPLVNLPTQVMAANVGEYGTIAILHTNKGKITIDYYSQKSESSNKSQQKQFQETSLNISTEKPTSKIEVLIYFIF